MIEIDEQNWKEKTRLQQPPGKYDRKKLPQSRVFQLEIKTVCFFRDWQVDTSSLIMICLPFLSSFSSAIPFSLFIFFKETKHQKHEAGFCGHLDTDLCSCLVEKEEVVGCMEWK